MRKIKAELMAGSERVKVRQGQNDAAEQQQPWRCAVCRKAVRKGMSDPCDCTRKEEQKAKRVCARCGGELAEGDTHVAAPEGARKKCYVWTRLRPVAVSEEPSAV